MARIKFSIWVLVRFRALSVDRVRISVYASFRIMVRARASLWFRAK
jgi:hypothetical protein